MQGGPILGGKYLNSFKTRGRVHRNYVAGAWEFVIDWREGGVIKFILPVVLDLGRQGMQSSGYRDFSNSARRKSCCEIEQALNPRNTPLSTRISSYRPMVSR